MWQGTNVVTMAEAALKISGTIMSCLKSYQVLLKKTSAANSTAASEAGKKQTGASMHATCYVAAATAVWDSCLPQEI